MRFTIDEKLHLLPAMVASYFFLAIEVDKENTEFVTHHGLFEFEKIPCNYMIVSYS